MVEYASIVYFITRELLRNCADHCQMV